ncbi:hypothetical protein SARC_13806, partial [Sphaeroforma arctica JP610]
AYRGIPDVIEALRTHEEECSNDDVTRLLTVLCEYCVKEATTAHCLYTHHELGIDTTGADMFAKAIPLPRMLNKDVIAVFGGVEVVVRILLRLTQPLRYPLESAHERQQLHTRTHTDTDTHTDTHTHTHTHTKLIEDEEEAACRSTERVRAIARNAVQMPELSAYTPSLRQGVLIDTNPAGSYSNASGGSHGNMSGDYGNAPGSHGNEEGYLRFEDIMRCATILRWLASPHTAVQLAHHHELICTLLLMCKYRRFMHESCYLLEETLSHRERALDLHTVPGLFGLLSEQMDPWHLAYVSRVLAVTVVECTGDIFHKESGDVCSLSDVW